MATPLSGWSEQALLAQARLLNKEALTEVYDRYQQDLYRYAVRLLEKPDAAEECVAVTFDRFLRSLHRGQGPQTHLRAYLYRIAHNWINDFYRAPSPFSLTWLTLKNWRADADPHTALEQAQGQDAVRQALLRLTPDQRQVIMLKFYEGWSNKEVATSLNKPVGAVKSLQYRALASLQRMLVNEPTFMLEQIDHG